MEVTAASGVAVEDAVVAVEEDGVVVVEAGLTSYSQILLHRRNVTGHEPGSPRCW